MMLREMVAASEVQSGLVAKGAIGVALILTATGVYADQSSSPPRAHPMAVERLDDRSQRMAVSPDAEGMTKIAGSKRRMSRGVFGELIYALR